MMGRLCNLTKGDFASRIRDRGQAYYRKGRVNLKEVTDEHLTATVHGSKLYHVALEYLVMDAGPELTVDCTCPYFQGTDCCKHIWATLMAADAEGLLQPGPDIGWIDLDADSLRDGDTEVTSTSHSHPSWQHPSSSRRSPSMKLPNWKNKLQKAGHEDWLTSRHANSIGDQATSPREVETRFEIPTEELYYSEGLLVKATSRTRRKDGLWGKWKTISSGADPTIMPDNDYFLAIALTGAVDKTSHYAYGGPQSLRNDAAMRLLPCVCATNRLFAISQSKAYGPLKWDEGAPWEFALDLRNQRNSFGLHGLLVRNGERKSLDSPLILLSSGWIIWPDNIARLSLPGGFGWLSFLRKEHRLDIPKKDLSDFLNHISGLHSLPKLLLPEELQFEEISETPIPTLHILKPPNTQAPVLSARLSFDYAGHEVDPARLADVYEVDQHKVIRRNHLAEKEASSFLRASGGRSPSYGIRPDANCEVTTSRLRKLVPALLEAGWRVLAQGKLYRSGGNMQVSVKSGIDWFDLHATYEFDGAHASLPQILKALKKKEAWVQLSDGSFGMLPTEWLRKNAGIAALAEEQGDVLRFQSMQAGFLDAWIATQPEVDVDAVFARAQKELDRFSSVKPKSAPKSFHGVLRPYQKDGLGWLLFLQQFGFGGCLADDMGLGKTVQVLALLEIRRAARARTKNTASRGISLVVAPRSVVFNWIREAERFTPKLRVLEHAGNDRAREAQVFNNYDVILTTYGTLRRDIGLLKDVHFDYAILDESQAVKNAGAQVSKAARLLQADHRLALSGTPIENHLGELWSLFEFLNPGLLGNLTGFNKQWVKNPEPEQCNILAKTVRPFILRRTKGQVATDLPDRQEETLFCDLPDKQRAFYKALLDNVRQSVLSGVEERGLARSKIQVLEALLRLRQAACHPGLIHKDSLHLPSAKFDALLPQLEEVIEEGHKALVFSQFTSFLALLRQELDTRGIVYEYLDGRTRRRDKCVDRFQQDEKCPLFLISLKAGGLGLNLTAAEYVFLLDPWWNPAVEAQAIDRAHRIGQQNKVFAYRLIARDTIEEKVLELQARKRELAASIINEDNALVRNLTKDDLEYLFS